MYQNFTKSLPIIIGVVAFILLPTLVTATTTTPSTSTPIISPTSIQEAMGTDKIDHGRISIDFGIPRRISSSPSGLIELDMSPNSILNRQLLEIYARKLALTEPIKDLSISEQSINLTISGPARLLGIIPIKLPHDVSVELDGSNLDINIKNKTSWSWLATKPSPDGLTEDIKQQVSQGNYISITQLKAHILSAIVEVVDTR